MISLEKVAKRFESKNESFQAVKDVNLTIERGEIFGIVGYSGAGKSTLLRMINGLEQPSSGLVKVDDKELSTMKRRTIRKERQSMGMIFQHFNLLWSRTVMENICFPLEIAGVGLQARRNRAQELIDLVGLQGKEHAYPAQLSGGEKQRVGIARALANNPKVLLCDEATSALDPQTTDEVLDLLVKVKKEFNVTIVLITHEMEVVRKICDRVAVMNQGEIVEEGSVLSVFKHPQHPVTKRFVKQDQEVDSKEMAAALKDIQQSYSDGDIVHLLFQGGSVGTPMITTVSRQCGIDINIIHGSIQSTKDVAMGTLVVQLLGDKEKREEALRLFSTYPVEVEVLKQYDRN